MSVVETKVKIKLNSVILPTDGESENYEMWLNGSFIKKSGKNYLRYVEELDEQQIRTTVKMGDEQALIIRHGGVNMRLPFNKEFNENGHYETQFGTLPIEIKTDQLVHEHREEKILSGEFKVHYDLIINGQSVGKYKLEIHYSEGQK